MGYSRSFGLGHGCLTRHPSGAGILSWMTSPMRRRKAKVNAKPHETELLRSRAAAALAVGARDVIRILVPTRCRHVRPCRLEAFTRMASPLRHDRAKRNTETDETKRAGHRVVCSDPIGESTTNHLPVTWSSTPDGTTRRHWRIVGTVGVA